MKKQSSISLHKAIGQKLVLSFDGCEIPDELRRLLQRYPIGGVTLYHEDNIVSAAQVRALTAELQSVVAQAGFPPLLIAADQEGGQLMAIDRGPTLFPGNMALGATQSPELAWKAGQILAIELAAMGVNVNYAPVCDINSNPKNPAVGTRAFGDDPATVSRFITAMIQGMQQAGVAATAKHFPGHGDTSEDSHYEVPIVLKDRDALLRTEIPPFQAAIAAEIQLIMTGHIAFPGISAKQPSSAEGYKLLPATFSKELLGSLLREQLGFKGVIISDALDMLASTDGALIADSLSAVLAGVDLLLLKGTLSAQENVFCGLSRASERGLIPSNALMASSRRIALLKKWLNLPQPPLELVGCAEHRAVAFEIAARSLTLVRNRANLLPLRPSSQERWAVIMPKPQDLTPSDTSSFVKCQLASELRKYQPALDEFILSYAPDAQEIEAIRSKAHEYTYIIVGTINALTEPQQGLLVRTLQQTGVPVIPIALRTPYDLETYPEAETFICTYSILAPTMEALAQALLGQLPFPGKLPVALSENM